MNNLALRSLTALTGAAVIIFCVLWNEYTYCILFISLSAALHYEFLQTCKHIEGYTSSNPIDFFNIGFGIAMQLFMIYTKQAGEQFAWIWIFAFLPLKFIVELFRKTPHPFLQIGMHFTAFVYIVFPVSLLFFIPFTHTNGALALIFLLMIWTNDTMAYFAGRAFGKHKLFERISPKKTWEGFFGGMICTIGAAFLMHIWYTRMSGPQLAGMAMIVVVFGTLGDLVESMFKRSIHIKDSGSILPGHGGFLDRFDAFLLALPFVFVYLVLIGVA